MSIWGNPVMIGSSGGGGLPQPFYLIDPEQLDILREAIGGTSPTMIGASSQQKTYTPDMALSYQSTSGDKFYMQQYTLDSTTKDYLYKGTSMLGSIASPTKIQHGLYSKMYMSFVVTANRSNSDSLTVGLGRTFSWGSVGQFNMDLMHINPLSTSPALNTLIEVEQDISNIEEDFYLGFYTYGVPIYIREFSLIP